MNKKRSKKGGRKTAKEAPPEVQVTLEDLLETEEEEEVQQQTLIELLTFTVGEEKFALEVSEIKEIIKHIPFTPVPRCPDFLLGVISLRGEIIPIIDLRSRLGLGKTTVEGEEVIIVVHHGEESAGHLVKNISGIIKVEENAVELAPEVVPPEKAEFLLGVVRHQENLITILNNSRLLDVSEIIKNAD